MTQHTTHNRMGYQWQQPPLHCRPRYFSSLGYNYILDILMKNNVLAYYRYVDDILIIYSYDNMNINRTLIEYNNLHHKVQFTLEK